jgi:hypothetical protein
VIKLQKPIKVPLKIRPKYLRRLILNLLSMKDAEEQNNIKEKFYGFKKIT